MLVLEFYEVLVLEFYKLKFEYFPLNMHVFNILPPPKKKNGYFRRVVLKKKLQVKLHFNL